jgi:chromosomal replication initiator protein
MQWQAGELRLVCSSAAQRQWLERNLRPVIADACRTVVGHDVRVVFETNSSAPPAAVMASTGASAAARVVRSALPVVRESSRQPVALAADAAATFRVGPALRGAAQSEVDPSEPAGAAGVNAAARRRIAHDRWQFSTFCAGPCNQMALQAAHESVRHLGRYSPLVLHGPNGCGKTHLLHAIAADLRRGPGRPRVLHLTSEQFTSQFLEAIERRQSPGFRQKCRSVDAILIDDIQFLSTKRATIGELLMTIDAVQQSGGQVVLSADAPPNQWPPMCADLANRAVAGLTVGIDAPGYETRLAIVRQFAARCRLKLGPGVDELVAQRVTGSGRLLAGAINRMAAQSSAQRRPIDVSLAEQALESFCREHAPQVRLTDIQRAVCEVFGVEPGSLKSNRRTAAVVQPRMLAMWLARKYTRAALSEISEFFGRRSHSTVISAQQKIDGLVRRKADMSVRENACQVEEVVRRVEAALRVG